MNQEELKTCLGQLLLDLRMNWAYSYSDRLELAKELCLMIEIDTSDILNQIQSELNDGDYDGRCFRNVTLYGYSSEEGTSEEVKKWLNTNLTHPELCEILD